ncbi:MAG: PilN domain-containing protein [Rhodocyclaceae bacterium]|nr:PilN domain-containing protein [Rhodocyclaceae bacterium]
MIRINLLPHRAERRKLLRQQFYVLAGLIVVLAGLIWFAGYAYINRLIERQVDANNFLKKEIAILDEQIKEIKKLQDEIEALKKRKEVIEELQANRSETVHMFNELAKRLPTGVYLTSIKQDQQKIALTGYAQSNARVSTLMRNLDESPVFERPTLIQIKAAMVGKTRLNEFELNIFFTRQTAETGAKPGGKP